MHSLPPYSPSSLCASGVPPPPFAVSLYPLLRAPRPPKLFQLCPLKANTALPPCSVPVGTAGIPQTPAAAIPPAVAAAGPSDAGDRALGSVVLTAGDAAAVARDDPAAIPVPGVPPPAAAAVAVERPAVTPTAPPATVKPVTPVVKPVAPALKQAAPAVKSAPPLSSAAALSPAAPNGFPSMSPEMLAQAQVL